MLMPSTPVKHGYKFIGWYTDSNLTTKFNEESSIDNDITVYAKWEEQEDYELEIISGTGSKIGDEVALGPEHFYVISDDGKTTKLLAKWNLNVGEYKNNQKLEGLQDESAKGYIGTRPGIGSVTFDDATGIYNNASKETIYMESSIKKIVDDYKTTLEDLGLNTIKNARLITCEELEFLGGNIDSERFTNDNLSWVYQTSYWTGTVEDIKIDDENEDEEIDIYTVSYDGTLGTAGSGIKDEWKGLYGVRPVIEIPSLNKAKVIELNNDFVINIKNSDELVYSGDEIIPNIELKYKNENLDINEFIITTDDDFSTAGIKTYIVKLKDDSQKYRLLNGNMIDSKNFNATILQKNIDAIIEIPELHYQYTGEEIKPNFVVKDENGVQIPVNQYDVSYKNNINAGIATITVKSKENANYIFEKTTSFEIKAIEGIENIDIEIEFNEYTYTGSEIKPGVTIKDDQGNVIANTEYTLTYENNVYAGTGKIIIKSKEGANHSFEHIEEFNILPKEIATIGIYIDKDVYEYTGKEIKPEVIVKDENGVVIPKNHYSVKYKNNIEVGTATITVTSLENANYRFNGEKIFNIK